MTSSLLLLIDCINFGIKIFAPLSAPGALQTLTSHYVVSFQQSHRSKTSVCTPPCPHSLKQIILQQFSTVIIIIPSHLEVSSNTRGCHQSKKTSCTKRSAHPRSQRHTAPALQPQLLRAQTPPNICDFKAEFLRSSCV